MSSTYSNEPTPYAERVEPVDAEPFIPVYARKRSSRRKGGVKTWMILAPVGALALGGIAAALIMGNGEKTAEPVLVESAATLPVLPATPMAPAATLPTPALTIDTTDVPPAVAVREQAPVRRATASAPARRVASVPAATATSTTRAETPPTPTTPQPYAISPGAPSASASTPIPAPTPTLPVEPRAPAITTQPLE